MPTPSPAIELRRIGRDAAPLVVIDGFAGDPGALRAAARAATFVPAGEHYPGLRAALPDGWLRGRMPTIAAAIGRAFGRVRRVHVVDASFSIVTTPPAALSVRQRLPHCDAFGAERIALVQYLSRGDDGGTAFYRHRATGFEHIDDARAPTYFAALDRELGAGGGPEPAYLTGDTPVFEQTAQVEARYDRAVLYRSYLLHSGIIAPDATLSADPAKGRLTVTAFFAVE